MKGGSSNECLTSFYEAVCHSECCQVVVIRTSHTQFLF